jgi:hypothetical protein
MDNRLGGALESALLIATSLGDGDLTFISGNILAKA